MFSGLNHKEAPESVPTALVLLPIDAL